MFLKNLLGNSKKDPIDLAAEYLESYHATDLVIAGFRLNTMKWTGYRKLGAAPYDYSVVNPLSNTYLLKSTPIAGKERLPKKLNGTYISAPMAWIAGMEDHDTFSYHPTYQALCTLFAYLMFKYNLFDMGISADGANEYFDQLKNSDVENAQKFADAIEYVEKVTPDAAGLSDSYGEYFIVKLFHMTMDDYSQASPDAKAEIETFRSKFNTGYLSLLHRFCGCAICFFACQEDKPLSKYVLLERLPKDVNLEGMTKDFGAEFDYGVMGVGDDDIFKACRQALVDQAAAGNTYAEAVIKAFNIK